LLSNASKRNEPWCVLLFQLWVRFAFLTHGFMFSFFLRHVAF